MHYFGKYGNAVSDAQTKRRSIMANDEPDIDEDEARAIMALRAMDDVRRREMVERLVEAAREHPKPPPSTLKIVPQNKCQGI